jgi:altered-inheritance-of-mitochondria protein 5
VTLTLSLTYLALHTHSRNRQAQSAILRSQASTLDLFIPPDIDTTLPPAARRRNASAVLPDGTYRPRATLEHHDQQRRGEGRSPGASFIEAAKTRWNSEVLAAVHWAQGKDWARARERAEDGVAGLFGVSLSREPVQVEEVVFVSSSSVAAAAAAQQGQEGQQQQQQQQVAAPRFAVVVQPRQQDEAGHHRVSDALHRAGDRTAVVAQAMREEAKEVVAEAREVVATGVKEARGAVERGVEKAHDLVERTKAAVHLAEERAEAKVDAKLLHVSDIERALAERYDNARREEQLKRSVDEVLRERYNQGPR